MKALLSRLFPHNWNDVLSLIVIIGVPVLWLLDAYGPIDITLSEAVIGATILAWGNVVQFYFRRAPPSDNV